MQNEKESHAQAISELNFERVKLTKKIMDLSDFSVRYTKHAEMLKKHEEQSFQWKN